MTPPSPEAVAAAVERLKGEVAAARRIQKINPFLYHFMDDVDTLIAGLAAQTEELANHYHDFKRIRQLMMCDGSDFEQLESKWNSVQAELTEARKDVERFRTGIAKSLDYLKAYIPRKGSLVDSAIEVLDAAMQQEQP